MGAAGPEFLQRRELPGPPQPQGHQRHLRGPALRAKWRSLRESEDAATWA
ncbi:hypothetical protein P4233_16190 [Pseudomonas aeruginosa]|nr:hypothetical protein [Pseudomonas aeruginosa]